FVRAALAGFAVLVVIVLVYGFWASTFDLNLVKEMPQRSMVFDMDARLYSRLQGENRIVVSRRDVSKNFVEPLLAREDSRYFTHHGVDPIGIARALVKNITSKSAKQGASTITQQLARNTFPLGGKNVHRKLLEAFVAARIEQNYTKEQILEHYMNRVYLGAGVYGVETASLAYFGKSAKDLSLGEGAMLAGIIRAPTYYSPRKNMKGALAQRDQVLDRLVKTGKLSRSEADAARRAPIALSRRPRLMLQENYAMEAVREDIEVLLSDEQQAEGGFKIYTTIDPELQKRTEQAIEANLRKIEQRPGYAHPPRSRFASLPEDEKTQTPYLQGAAIVIDHRTGSIRAIVGGRDYGESQLNRARSARRQTGSTFKPFVYAAAFGRGMLPGALIDDGPIRRGEIAAAPTWQPGNSDGAFKGALAAEEGLIQSRNTMSVRVGERAGIGEVIRLATAAGFDDVPRQPAIYLGAFESTLTDVASAYALVANQGIKRQPYIIERIDDALGETIYRAPRVAPRMLDSGICWLTTAALTKTMERGSGAGVKAEGFAKPCAGKTGTTNDYVDAWFVGYTTSLTCGVWVGLDQPRTIVSRGYGAALALPIWADVMAAAPAVRYPAKEFPAPDLRRTMACSSSNELATDACQRAGTAYSIDLPLARVPNDACHVHRGSVVTRRDEPRKPETGLLKSFRKFFGGQ
ncbi:MAG: PBP1A family penicillin-binding protein, partial [Chthoniobacteraceae bacterium]